MFRVLQQQVTSCCWTQFASHNIFKPLVRNAASSTHAVIKPADGLTALRQALASGPGLQHFIVDSNADTSQRSSVDNDIVNSQTVPNALAEAAVGQTFYIETKGCQMNVSDSDIVAEILQQHGHHRTTNLTDADIVLLNTCAIRDYAEQKVWSRLADFKKLKQDRETSRDAEHRGNKPLVGLLGCMAERLKEALLEKDRLVDMVVGPDAYRDLPRIIAAVTDPEPAGHSGGAMNVQLSLEETYADIIPARRQGLTSAFISIMRGCNNMCAFCIVPFTRGRERSRPSTSIIDEVKYLRDVGVKHITLLGQNVNSYADFSSSAAAVNGTGRHSSSSGVYAEGFSSVYKPKRDGSMSFAELLDAVAAVDDEVRIAFTSPHPKDFNDDVLHVIAQRQNVCKQLHMPAQSGSSSVLQRMRRGYTRAAYDALVQRVRTIVPDVALSTDIIVGFCGETDEEHAATVDLMDRVQYDNAFVFAYSERPKTHAARHAADDVAADVKAQRLQDVLAAFRRGQSQRNAAETGRYHLVLVEGRSKKSDAAWQGRTDTLKRVVFDDVLMHADVDLWLRASQRGDGIAGVQAPIDSCAVHATAGDYVLVKVTDASAGTLLAQPLCRTTRRAYFDVVMQRQQSVQL